MNIPAECSSCGFRFSAPIIVGADPVTFIDCATNCPRCGAHAAIQSGTYQLVENAVMAFRAAGVTRQSVVRFRNLAEQVRAGDLTPEAASIEIEKLGASLATLWNWINQNGGALALLGTIITIYLTISAGWDADVAAEKQLKATQRTTQVVQSAERVQKKILEELRKQTEAATKPEAQSTPITGSQPPGLQQTPPTAAPMSRQQRRRADQIAKKRLR